MSTYKVVFVGGENYLLVVVLAFRVPSHDITWVFSSSFSVGSLPSMRFTHLCMLEKVLGVLYDGVLKAPDNNSL